MKLIKHTHQLYWADNGLFHGERKCWHTNYEFSCHCRFVEVGRQIFDVKVGQSCINAYYVSGDLVHDFLANPLSDEEKVLLVLKYGAPLLPKEELLCYER